MKPVLITGGCGFIGANLAQRLLSQGREVWLYDSLARAGVEQNARWLKRRFGDRVRLIVADVRDAAQLQEVIGHAESVYHFAAQVAVTTSLVQPLQDFEVNVRGTLNVLEALRRLENPPPLLFTSTNKVYGGLLDLTLAEGADGYTPECPKTAAEGIGEDRSLAFCSPYGCSKGAADQYVLDYARSYGIPAVVFRMSCIYGPRQFGNEDQGWVAHFLRAAMAGEPIVIYGDGKQVRDILFVSDLLDAMQLAREHIATLSGQAFNIGGGPENAVSLRETLAFIQNIVKRPLRIRHEGWRASDQRYYVSNTARFRHCTGWAPHFAPSSGLLALHAWLRESVAEVREASAFGSREAS